MGGYGSYTRGGLTHGHVDHNHEYGIQARLLSQTYIQAGYRYLRSDYGRSGTQTLHSGPVLGVNVRFLDDHKKEPPL